MLQIKQKGFTLLELLVVITLLALLSVGALVVYDGVGEKASDAAAANNIVTLNRALRQAAVVNNGLYPDQWDTILDENGDEPCWDGKKNPNRNLDTAGTCNGGQPILADATKSFLTKFTLGNNLSDVNSASFKVARALEAVGITTIQTVEDVTPITVASGLIFNEGGNPEVAEENDIIRANGLTRGVSFAAAISGGDGACTADGQPLSTPLLGAAVTNSAYLNLLSDRLEEEDCHLVLALGIGHDVAGQGAAGTVGLDTAPTYNSSKVNAAYNYSRYLGLFYLGTAADGANVVADDILPKARLVAVVDTEGRNVDQAISGAFASSN